jgi:hypothetical protein
MAGKCIPARRVHAGKARRPIMKLSRVAFPLLVLTLATPVAPVMAEEGWTFQTSLGVVENLETQLTIRQSGFLDVELDAE